MKRLLHASVNLLPQRARHWIKYIPLVAAGQRWLVDRFLSREPFIHLINVGPARGLSFEVVLPLDKAVWAGTFEPEFSAELRHGVRSGDVCYDIGGYRGYMAGVLALAGAQHVITFEPLPDNITALKRLAQLNPELSLRVEESAVGNADGSAGFRVMPDQSMGKLATSTFQSDAAEVHEIRVRLGRLDTFVFERGLPAPNLLKIDVEGAEVEVLKGAVRTISELRPKVFLEAHSAALADVCHGLLARLDYEVRVLELGALQFGQTRHLIALPK